MQLQINRDVVEWVPESEAERAALEAFWLLLIPSGDCAKRLVPQGAFPGQPGASARFRIDGLSLAEKNGLAVNRAPREQDYDCPVCGKVRRLRAGEIVPRCCGREMEPQG